MKIKNELILSAIVLTPFIYLAYIWNELAEKIPMHWNIKGEIDRFGDKEELILIPILFPLFVYIIFLILPRFDSKNKIEKMGKKYQNLKTLLTIFMSVLAVFIIYMAKNQTAANINSIVLLIGALYIILGNYFQTIQTNYFIGIRTPWTLKNKTVWKDTHKIGGKLWFLGGFIVALSSLFLEKTENFILFMIITGAIVIVPIVYSYFQYKKINNLTL